MNRNLNFLIYTLTIGLFAISITSCEKENSPTVETLNVTEITKTTAVAKGSISDDGGAAITARGVCWSTNNKPTINDSKSTTSGIGIGSFSNQITDLELNTTYYVRAFAINSKGISYGNAISFNTLYHPTLSTTKVSDITSTNAISGGYISDDGGSPITARGVCWDTYSNPSIYSNKTEDGEGIGAFSSTITDLMSKRTYYVRAYITNSEGTSYGNELSFTTPDIPVLNKVKINDISTTSIILESDITDDGGGEISARGFCWSTKWDEPPTIDDDKIEDATGSGSFSSKITNLKPDTEYYVRAYAISNGGTGYSTYPVYFRTLAGTFTDSRDNNIYGYKTYGNNVWMAENLRYLPSVVGPQEGSSSTSCYYVYDYNDNDVASAKDTENFNKYGVLYNWPAVNANGVKSEAKPDIVRGVCPEGWHLPTYDEVSELFHIHNPGIFNILKFKGLGGKRDSNGVFNTIEQSGYYWLHSNYVPLRIEIEVRTNGHGANIRQPNDSQVGFSVRCVRD